MIEELSKYLDLSNTEAKVYLTLLKQGSVTTGTISKDTKFRTSTIYYVLEKLLSRGLVTFIYKSKIKYFQATPPEAYLDFLEEKKQLFAEFLPKIKQMQKPSSQKTAKVYEGIKGIKAAFSDILNSLGKGDNYYFFQAPELTLDNKVFIRFIRNYHLKRAEKGIKVKGLTLKACKTIVNKTFKGIKHTKIRFVDSFIPHGLIIFADKTIILDWQEEPSAYVIESKNIAENYSKFFEDRWKTAIE